jgi:hypothetical protein
MREVNSLRLPYDRAFNTKVRESLVWPSKRWLTWLARVMTVKGDCLPGLGGGS